ncbi:MAG: hypothetical protein ISR76_07595 [Planctomycetes bacterium]|nr:hypothetical protein [Planctomycetota bacterium]
MLELLPALLLSAALAPQAGAQEPAAPPAAEKVLARALRGDLLGPQQTPGGPARGWMRFEQVLDGQWVRCIGASLAGGQPVYSFVQMMRERDDGAVEAWRFDSTGQVSAWFGKAETRGMSLDWTDEEGAVLARQEWGFENGDCDFRLLRRASEGAAFTSQVAGLLRAGGQRPTWKPSAAAELRLEQNPYAFYLGTFRGKESSVFGDSEGSTRTEGILDGQWFHSSYRSEVAGRSAYSGQGFVRCGADGRYQLHWFDTFGDHQVLDGALGEDGAVAFLRDGEGDPVERHTDRYTAAGYTFRIEKRDGPDDPWKGFMTATYTRMAEPPPAPPGEDGEDGQGG